LNLKTTIKKLSPTFISAGISYENARRLGVDNGSRIKVIKGEKFAVSIVFVFNSLVPNDEIIVDPALADELKIKEGETVSVSYESMSLSAIAIRNFLSGEKLSKEHYYEIVKDTVLGRLSDVELTSFIVAQMYRKMEIEDIENLTRAMADLGEK
jgi:Thymidine phosphorylase